MRVLLFSIFLLSGCTTVSRESVSHNRGYVDGCKSKIAASLSLPKIKNKMGDVHYQSGWESGFEDCDGVM
jgi:hypothetical protein